MLKVTSIQTLALIKLSHSLLCLDSHQETMLTCLPNKHCGELLNILFHITLSLYKGKIQINWGLFSTTSNMLEISNTDISSWLERWDLFIVINEETKQSKTGQGLPCPVRHIKLCDVVVCDWVFRIGAVRTVLSDTVELRPCMDQAILSTDIHSSSESTPQIISNLTLSPSMPGLLPWPLVTNHRYWLMGTTDLWFVDTIISCMDFMGFFVACCDMLEPICLLSNKQNDKRNLGNIAQISKIVYYHLLLLICWHLQLINKWKMVRTLKLTWSLWEA